ncbi:hypothetical protein D3H55_16905 [Bacillus salacetis]|uniref:Carboxypeptidase regulatory-like domain-containing protein n=1 Tax=Bacillus salacetis TaxID=2315464 RepID=A0A3A1QSQ7_9BACI|nr:hypothetical protein [Bacillus salacetis]RIW30413.1 hypothetical protein D3H55_16905 [Bacillus salacetis]
MKKILLFFCVVMIGLSAGCSTPKKEVQLEGRIKTVGNHVIVNGTSSLEENAVITVQLKDIDSQQVEKETEVKTDKDGNYQVQFVRDRLETQYELSVAFNPSEQDEDIKKIYGGEGENIAASSIGFDEEYQGIKLYDRILPIGEGSVGQKTNLSAQMPEY